jgi:hypothetical protein
MTGNPRRGCRLFFVPTHAVSGVSSVANADQHLPGSALCYGSLGFPLEEPRSLRSLARQRLDLHGKIRVMLRRRPDREDQMHRVDRLLHLPAAIQSSITCHFFPATRRFRSVSRMGRICGAPCITSLANRREASGNSADNLDLLPDVGGKFVRWVALPIERLERRQPDLENMGKRRVVDRFLGGKIIQAGWISTCQLRRRSAPPLHRKTHFGKIPQGSVKNQRSCFFPGSGSFHRPLLAGTCPPTSAMSATPYLPLSAYSRPDNRFLQKPTSAPSTVMNMHQRRT